MQDSPVLKLQDMASSSSTNIEDLLSRAKMISVKLGLTDISEWIEFELKSYPSFDSLPDYRILHNVPIRAFNPFHGWIPFNLDNTTDKNREVYDSLTTVHLTNPVSMLTEFAKRTDTLYSELPPFMTAFLHEVTDCDFRMAWSISPTQIKNVLSNIRSRVLEWALLLESKGILGEGSNFTQREKSEAANVTIINNGDSITVMGDMSNGSGVIAAGTTGGIHQQNTIVTGDFSTLSTKLKEHGVDDSDISELKQVIDQSSKPESKEEVEKVFGGWLGKMIGKAYSGTIKIAGAAAPTVLTNAVCQYFGITV